MTGFGVGRWSQALVLMLGLGFGAGCAADASVDGVASCEDRMDCRNGEQCGPQGRCVPEHTGADTTQDADALSCEASDCDEVPGPACEGDQLVTFYAACEDGQCAYPIGSTLACELGCEDGRCKADACADVYCDAPPEPSCLDAQTRVTYAPTGVCDAGECGYAASETPCVHGCSDGECNAGACDQAVCQSPPGPRCEGNTGRVYASVGVCVEDGGFARCEYELTFNNCDYVGGQCQPTTGTCVNARVETGRVAIVEVMANPSGIPDAEAEWFEVRNLGASAIDFNGWKIRSGTSGSTVEEHLIAGAPLLGGGEHFVFAVGGDPGGDGSITPDYIYSGVLLSNSSDWIELVDADGQLSDRVFWEVGAIMDGNAMKFAPASGSSQSAAALNNSFEQWCPELSKPYGSLGNFGSPGQPNPPCAVDACAGVSCETPEDVCLDAHNARQYPSETVVCQVSRFRNPYCDFAPTTVTCDSNQYCLDGACEGVPGRLPAPGEVIITELMGNPNRADAEGEYIELYNTTNELLTLFTLTVEDNEAGAKHNSSVISEPTATIQPRGYAVLAVNTDPAVNGGIDGAYHLADSPLKNSVDAAGLMISVRLPNGTLIDEAYYGAPTPGVSQQLSLDAYTDGATNIAASNDTGANFCGATLAPGSYAGSGELGSPGAANETCP